MTRIVPISAAIAAPTRPATISAGDHRPQLARDRQHDDGGDRALGVEPAEPGIGLQRQHHAGEQRGQADHRQREIADIDDLAQDQPGIEGRREQHWRARAAANSASRPVAARKARKTRPDRGEEFGIVSVLPPLAIDAVIARAERGQDLVADGPGVGGDLVDPVTRDRAARSSVPGRVSAGSTAETSNVSEIHRHSAEQRERACRRYSRSRAG